MDILKYFKEVKAQKQINKLAKKYKNKKIVIYGAGEYFKILSENFDTSKLNIVAISDKKFNSSKDTNTTNYTPITPNELKTYDYDVIMVALYDDASVMNFLEYSLLLDTPNEDKEIIPIIEPSLWYLFRLFVLEK